MKYPDGSPLKIGHKVQFSDHLVGTVVCNIGTGEYSSEFSEAAWGYLGGGVMVMTTEAGLVHYSEDFSDSAERIGE